MTSQWYLTIQMQQYALTQGKIYLVGGLPFHDKCPEIISLMCESVEASHCIIEVYHDNIEIFDLFSQFGTFVNNVRLEPLQKVKVIETTTIQIGRLTGQLCVAAVKKLNDNDGFCEEVVFQSEVDSTKSREIANQFLEPMLPSRMSSSANTSSRLFDDESFIIPDTQLPNCRSSVANISIQNSSRENSLFNKNDDQDDSFIPETQQALVFDAGDNVDTSGNVSGNNNKQNQSDMFRICTEDFNENNCDEIFTSLVIPKMQHDRVILEDVMLGDHVSTNVMQSESTSKQQDTSCDDEMEALNSTARTTSAGGSTEETQLMERDSACTPDLFYFPELNSSSQVSPQEMSKNSTVPEANSKDTAPVYSTMTANSGDTFAVKKNVESFEMMPTQLFVPIHRREKQPMEECLEKLSQSGKENNIPDNMDIALQPTQVFTKPKGDEAFNKNNMQSERKASTEEEPDNAHDIFMLAPTQIFPVKICNKQTFSTSIQKKALNSTLLPTQTNEEVKSVASFITDIETNSDGKELIKNINNKRRDLKNLKRGDSVKFPSPSRDKNSEFEKEELEPSTPKLIRENFHDLLQEQDSTVKRIVLDSGEEIDTLVALKTSNDFGKLFSNIMEHVENAQNSSDIEIIKAYTLSSSSTNDEWLSKYIITNDLNERMKQKSEAQRPTLINKIKKTTPVTIPNEFLARKTIVAESKPGNEIKSESQESSKVSKDLATSKQRTKETSESDIPRKRRKTVYLLEHSEKNTIMPETNSSLNPKKTVPESKPSKEIKPKGSVSESKPSKGINPMPKSQKSSRRSKNISTSEKSRTTEQVSESEIARKRSKTVDMPKHSKESVSPPNAKKSLERTKIVGALKEDALIESKPESHRSAKDAKKIVMPESNISINRKNSVSESKSSKKEKSFPESQKSSKDGKNKAATKKRTSTERTTGSDKQGKQRRASSPKDSKEVPEFSKQRKSAAESIAVKDFEAFWESQKKKSKQAETSTHVNLKTTTIDNKINELEDTNNQSKIRAGSRSSLETSSATKHIVRVATTMVNAELIQNLLDKSSGRWCIVNEVKDADVLVMDKGIRTFKFLIAMAKGLPIFSTKWLESFNATKVMPRGKEYFFRDIEFEKRHKFTTIKSTFAAQKQKVFAGYEFLTTPNIMPNPTEIKDVVKCAGGKVYEKTPLPQENQNIYLISSPQDKNIWHSYRRTNSNIRITTTEGIMSAVMRHQITPLDTNRLS